MDAERTMHRLFRFTYVQVRTTRVIMKIYVRTYDAGMCHRFQIAPYSCVRVIEKLSTIQC